MNKTILEFYNQINVNPELKNEITNKILEYCKNNDTSQEKINMINEIILPEAKKLGFNFSAKELAEHENNVKNELTSEDLENVSGGVGVKAKVMGLFAALNLSAGILAGATSFAMDPQKSAPESTSKSNLPNAADLNTSGSTAQSENNSSNASSKALTQAKSKSGSADENQTMSKEETTKIVAEDIVTELKNSDFDFEIKVTKNDLHNLNADDDISKAIKNFNEKSKEIAKTLGEKSSFKSLKQLISSGDDEILNKTFESIKKGSLPSREEAAAMLILDDWAALNGFGHNTSVIASPYFIDENRYVSWPDNNGYKTDSKPKDIIGKMNINYKIDRYGSEYGYYVCSANDKEGVAYAKRSLSDRENKNFYHKYTVTRDFSELKKVVGELGLGKCLKLEKKAVEIYAEVKDQIKKDYQIKRNYNPYGKDDNFNYKQFESFIKNKDSINHMLVSTANKNQVKQKFDELETILFEYDQVFETAQQDKPDQKDKIQNLQNITKSGLINLTDNLVSAKANSGTIAPAFKQEGGGEQIEIPCSINLLKSLGFLQDATD